MSAQAKEGKKKERKEVVISKSHLKSHTYSLSQYFSTYRNYNSVESNQNSNENQCTFSGKQSSPLQDLTVGINVGMVSI